MSVKEAVLPFNRFPGVDTVLGPEMRSTGEVMGMGESFGIAFAKAQLAAGTRLPDEGQVFMSLADRDKVGGLVLARQLVELGFQHRRDSGHRGLPAQSTASPVRTLVGKIGLADLGADAVTMMGSGEVQLVVNTPSGGGARADGAAIRARLRRARGAVPDDVERRTGRGEGHRRHPRARLARAFAPGAARVTWTCRPRWAT